MTPEQNTTRSPDEPMNTSNEERERLKRLAEEAAPGGRWALRVNPATILSLIAENEAQAARVKALEEAGRNLKFALEVTDACLRTWNEGRGGPADVEGVLSRASALLHQGEADHGR
jgi:hypothetical protein